MADIRLKKISVDNSPLIIQNGNINITNTTVSNSILTGTIVSNGGISINCTHDALSSTSGGALTVGGGISTMKNMYVGKSVILDSLESTIKVNGISENRLFLDNVTNKQFYISLDGVYKTFEITEDGVYINNNTPSENFTTGALRISGGITINSSEESTSVSSGSGLSVFGGAGIVKKLFVGGGIESINSTNTIGNIYTITNGNVGIGSTNPLTLLSIKAHEIGSKITLKDSGINDSHFGFGVSSTQLNYDVENTTDDHVFYSNSKNGNGTELVRIKGTGKVDITGNLTVSDYINPSNGTNANGIIFENDTAWIKNYETDVGKYNLEIVNASDNIVLIPFGNVGINTTSPNYELDVVGTINSTGYTGENLQLSGDISSGSINTTIIHANTYTGGNISVSGIIASNEVVTETIIVKELIPGSSITVQNKLLIQGEENIDRYIQFKSNNSNSGVIFSEDDFSFYQCINNGNLSISGTTGNLNVVGERGIDFFVINTSGNVGINTTNPQHKLHVDGNAFVSGNVTLGSLYIVGNKIGINNINPIYNLDINTDTRISNILTIDNNVPSYSFTTGTLLIKGGGVGVNCTEEASSYTSGGALTIAGGASINKSVYIKENAYIKGILTLENIKTSMSVTDGSLVIIGGVGIGKDINVGGITSTEKFVIINNQPSLNSTSASFLCAGGISIQSEQNATSSTAGGSLTISGGIGIRKDIYIDGNGYQRGSMNYYSESNSFIQIYDADNQKIYSLDRDYFGNTFGLSRYNAGSLIEKTFELSHDNGTLKFNNKTNSSSTSVASIIVEGGISINSTQNSENSTVGGALSVYGGQSIAKNLNIGGSLYISGTDESIHTSSGSIIVKGGVSIWKSVNINGNTTINGDLYVKGNTTSLESTNTVLKDNILILNSAPSGIKDSGIIITRFQEDNDLGFGDIVSEDVYADFQIPNQVGMENTEIRFPIAASNENDYYNNWWIKITSGFSSNQVRKIIGYDGSTKIATVSTNWTLQNPAETDIVFLYNRVYVGLIYNETDDMFVFGSTLNDPGSTSVSLTDNIKVKMGEIVISGTTTSSNSSSGAVVVTGGVSINCTNNATSNTLGGSLTISGGASIGKTLYIGEELYVNNANLTPNPGDKWKSTIFSAINNQASPQMITNLDMDTNAWGFDVYLTARLNADSDSYANYHLRGINKIDSWEIIKTYVGDDMGLEFYITNNGEIQYTTPNYSGFISLQFKWRVFAN